MTIRASVPLWRAHHLVQTVAMIGVATMALALLTSFLLSSFGFWPSLDVTLSLSDGTAIAAGQIIHGGAAAIAILMLAYMPAHWRMRALESSHRSFRLGMEDVERAYRAAHEEDRTGTFRLSAEYDAVRERMEFLASHPDLGNLEPEILELAAQMGRVGRDLADRYSDDAVGRARAFLEERQHEAGRMQDRIETALAASREIRRWHDRVVIDEDIARSRLNQLIAELDDILPEIGLGPVGPADDPDVIQLSERARKRDIAAE